MTAEKQDTKQDKPAAKAAPGPIPVRATALGYYGGRRRPGKEFSIKDESELGSWMERLDGKENPKALKK